jgi:hypothetical protein
MLMRMTGEAGEGAKDGQRNGRKVKEGQEEGRSLLGDTFDHAPMITKRF